MVKESRTILNTSFEDIQRTADQKIRKRECYERLFEFDKIVTEFESMANDFNIHFIDVSGSSPSPFTDLKDIRRHVLQKLCDAIVVNE